LGFVVSVHDVRADVRLFRSPLALCVSSGKYGKLPQLARGAGAGRIGSKWVRPTLAAIVTGCMTTDIQSVLPTIWGCA